jgi:hypothetical protein
VSPSLHAVLKELKPRPELQPDPDALAVFWVPREKEREQTVFRGMLPDFARPLVIRERSQVLIYGTGSAGKARLALTMAVEPSARHDNYDSMAAEFVVRADRPPDVAADGPRLKQANILVLSFLYGRDYYLQHLQAIIQQRFGLGRGEAATAAGECVDVIRFQPGFIDPETIVGIVRQRLRGAELTARPFTSVVVDGVHNTLMQFPLLREEPLLWSTLNRYFRTRGLRTITTFTFFGVGGLTGEGRGHDIARGTESETAFLIPAPVLPGHDLFFHLLVGTCDYTFSVGRDNHVSRVREAEVIRVTQESSPTSFSSQTLHWEPGTGRFRLPQ